MIEAYEPHDRLREYLKNNGIKHSFVAGQIQMPASSFSELVNGKKKMTASQLRRICEALDISSEVIICSRQDAV